MNDIKAILEIDFKSLILALAAILIGFSVLKKAAVEVFGWMGIETKWMRYKREQKEDLESLKGHNTEQDEKIGLLVDGMSRLEESVNAISESVQAMQKRSDEQERNMLRDRIGQSYRYYQERGYWNRMEKEAFEGLVASYESVGGKNGYVHEKCVPASLEWKIVD